MMTPELNARILEVELVGRTPGTKTTARWDENPKERREAPMKLYAKYLRYALSSLTTVAFGLFWN
jgi:hypothetical protein